MECCEGEIRCGAALSASDFGPAADVIHHPSRQQKVVWIAADFTDMKGGSGHHVGQVFGADLDHKVRIIHCAPELRFSQVTFETGRHPLEGVEHQEMGADMRAIPIAVMGAKNNLWPMRL